MAASKRPLIKAGDIIAFYLAVKAADFCTAFEASAIPEITAAAKAGATGLFPDCETYHQRNNERHAINLLSLFYQYMLICDNWLFIPHTRLTFGNHIGYEVIFNEYI